MSEIKKGHAIGHLVLGAILCFFAFLIIILSGVIAGKGDAGAILGPWWIGLMVRRISLLFCKNSQFR